MTTLSRVRQWITKHKWVRRFLLAPLLFYLLCRVSWHLYVAFQPFVRFGGEKDLGWLLANFLYVAATSLGLTLFIISLIQLPVRRVLAIVGLLLSICSCSHWFFLLSREQRIRFDEYYGFDSYEINMTRLADTSEDMDGRMESMSWLLNCSYEMPPRQQRAFHELLVTVYLADYESSLHFLATEYMDMIMRSPRYSGAFDDLGLTVAEIDMANFRDHYDTYRLNFPDNAILMAAHHDYYDDAVVWLLQHGYVEDVDMAPHYNNQFNDQGRWFVSPSGRECFLLDYP